MDAFLLWLGARFSEPSTWAGIALLGNAIHNGDWTSPAHTIQTIGGIIAVLAKEKSA